MESYRIKDLTFTYPTRRKPSLNNIDLTLTQGSFVTFCGQSGCGKTTLLRHLKPVLAPHGAKSGSVIFEGQAIESLTHREQSEKIGFVTQNPDNQIVTDKVWHELAFGLESLGMATDEIRLRVAEMASYFGIQNWFDKKVIELSGGQKQLLNLASVMAAQPSVLILDEPTSRLDPIAAADFLATIGRINRELGVTVLITEHRLEEVFPLSSEVVCMDEGRIFCAGTPSAVGESLRAKKHALSQAMPTPMRVYAAVARDISNKIECPITIKQGRDWLAQILADQPAASFSGNTKPQTIEPQALPVIELKEVWFRHEREQPDIVKGLSLRAYESDFLCILGGNGAGKTTTLSLISGIYEPYRGKVNINGKEIQSYSDQNLYGELLGVLPQNPQAMFVKPTVLEDLLEMLSNTKLTKDEKTQKACHVANICRIEKLLNEHPYDLSGGEQQRAALAKILLKNPKILLLDEPTKGLDAEFKQAFAEILRRLNNSGVAVIMASHDIEFCAAYAKRCAFIFGGGIVSEMEPRTFFAGNSFYTTAASRMSRGLIAGAVTADEIAAALEQTAPSRDIDPPEFVKSLPDDALQDNNQTHTQPSLLIPAPKRALSKRTLAAAFTIFLLIPLTMFFGSIFLNDRKYYFISVLIILETFIPFLMVFEGRKPQARELVVISVLCAMCVAGRTAFFMIPQFKPVTALTIIAGVAFGGEAGFLIGAVTGFISNIFFGQGPWTMWQMFAFGIIGFLSGVLFRKGILRRSRAALCVFGALTTFGIYGGIVNSANVIMSQPNPVWPMFMAAFLQGVPFDLIHAAATVIFLWLAAKPMLEKLDRIKLKYGLIS